MLTTVIVQSGATAPNGGSCSAKMCALGHWRSGQLCPADGPAGQRSACHCSLPGGAGKVGGDDVGGVSVEATAGPVIPHSGPGVCVGGGFLDIAERDPGVQDGGDECVPQSVRSDRLADPGPAGYPADDPPGSVPAQPPPVCGQEHRAVWPAAD